MGSLPDVGCEVRLVKDYGDGLYAVSEDGRVFSAAPRGNAVHKYQRAPWRELRPGVLGRGYLFVSLPRNGSKERVSALVHRLVATAFLSGEPKATVDHIDGNKLNNRAENLRWATHKENNAAAVALGIAPGISGERNPSARLTEDDVRCIRSSSVSAPILAAELGVSPATVYFVRQGKTWKDVK